MKTILPLPPFSAELRSTKLRRLLLVGLASCSLLPLARAQRMVVAANDVAPVSVEAASVSTEVTGGHAVTTFDLVFRNPNSRQLEGTFEFPLLEGQSVVRFALDIGGTLREAVPVEKERGRVVFEEIERRRVDPGLLEQTAGNNYRARVFPLPAGGTRRIVIAYQEALTRNAAGRATYRLPLAFPEKLRQFDLNVAVHDGATLPPQATTTLALALPEWGTSRTLRITRRNFAAEGLVELLLPPTSAPAVLTQSLNGRDYFCAEVPLPEFPTEVRKAPAVVGILWDASGSGRRRDHAKEFAFLDAWFRANPEVAVRLVCLRNVAEAPRTFAVRGGDWTELRRELEQTTYDGATSFDGLERIGAVKEWLLFSDGLLNFGTTDPLDQVQHLRAPVHAALASSSADPTALRRLSARTGGAMANLLTTPPEPALAALRNCPLKVWRVERDPEAVAQVFPEVGAEVSGGPLTVTGILRRPDATLRLWIGRNEAEAKPIEVAISRERIESTMAARAWATAKIAALSLDPERNRDDIRRTAQEFGIVTADTSLIVLETVADYVRYDIEPPAELKAQWQAARNAAQAERRKATDDHLDEVVADFEARVEWWRSRFTVRKVEQPVQTPEPMPTVVLQPQEIPARTESAATTPQAPAAPAAEPELAEAGTVSESDEEMVVLSPFVVSSSEDSAGYVVVRDTLAGTRVRTELRDVASSVSVITSDLLADTAISNADRLLTYTTDAEAAGSSGNFASATASRSPAIQLQAWSPNAGYLDHLRRVAKTERHAAYLEERADHEADAGFFADVGGFFIEDGERELGLRILSNLAELALEDPALLRILGAKLLQAGQAELAVPVYERVLALRGEEPQSRRDLALACAAARHFQRAVDLLWEVVEKPWHDRFPGIELLALGELNAVAASCGEPLDLAKVDPRLRRNLPVGLRVVLTWDADNCDIDLWVDDPQGERAIYSHPRTGQGGLLSCDFTRGYGPEEFLLRRPVPGKYTVRIDYFGDERNTLRGPVTAQVRVITGYGTPEQTEQRMTVRLDGESRTIEVGSVEIGR